MENVDEKQLAKWASEHELVTEVAYGDCFLYFKKPNKAMLGIVMAAEANGDPFAWPDVLLANCLLSGDKDAVSEDIGFLESLRSKVDAIIGTVNCSIEKQGDELEINFADGKKARLRKIDRVLYKSVITMAKEGNMPGAFQMAFNRSFIEGDKDIINDVAYLFSLIKKQNDWFGIVALDVKNVSRNWKG
jgi:hypothetical protein